jgi:hypothetical protein
MSVRGTIFPCENAQSYEEAIGHVTELFYPEEREKISEALLRKIDLFKEYFLVIGAFTHASTQTIISIKKQHKASWSDLAFRVFPANQMQEMARDFYGSDRKKEGWLVSEWMVDTQSVRPHHECVFVEKIGGAIKVLSIDRRPNFEGIKNYVLASFLPFGLPLHMYVSTQKRQHDWSQCPILTLDDLRQLYMMNDTQELYSFIEKTHTSMEMDREQKWKLFNSPYVLPQFMRLAQSVNDVMIYEKAVVEKGLIDRQAFEKVKAKMYQKNPEWESRGLEPNMLNRRITNRYIKYGRMLFNLAQTALPFPMVAG